MSDSTGVINTVVSQKEQPAVASEQQLNDTSSTCRLNPDTSRCSYYVERKRRFCKTERVPLRSSASTAAPAAATESAGAGGDPTAATPATTSTTAPTAYASIYCHMHALELASGYERATRSRKGLLAEGLVATADGGGGATTASGSVGASAGESASAAPSAAASPDKGARIPCPINPNHSIYAKDLAKHVKVCPDLRHDASKLPYYCADLHLGNRAAKGVFGVPSSQCVSAADDHHNAVDANADNAAATTTTTTTAHKRLSPDHLAALIEQVKAFYDANVASRVEDCSGNGNDAAADDNLASVPSSCAAEKEALIAQKKAELAALEVQLCSSPSSSSAAALLTRALSLRRHIRALGMSQQRQASKKHGEQHDQLCCLIESAILTQRGVVRYSASAPKASTLVDGSGSGVVADTVATKKEGSDGNPMWCVELGAGKAGLGQALHAFAMEGNGDALSIASSSSSSSAIPTTPFNLAGFIVADYGSFRHKADGKSKQKSTAADDDGTTAAAASPAPAPIPFYRARINVKDFELFECLESFAKGGSSGEGEACGDRIVGATAAVAAGQKRQRDEDGERRGGGEEREKSTAASGATMSGANDFFVIGKHLCGACTDFSVSSCFYGRGGGGGAASSCSSSPSSSFSVVPSRCQGIAIATCCHHRCETRHLNYCKENSTTATAADTASTPLTTAFFSFMDEEADAIISMTSWAVSGSAVSEEQQRVGWLCKRLIDYHRLLFIEAVLKAEGRLHIDADAAAGGGTNANASAAAAGRLTAGESWLAGLSASSSSSSPLKFRVRLVQYVQKAVTPENVALVMEPVL